MECIKLAGAWEEMAVFYVYRGRFLEEPR